MRLYDLKEYLYDLVSGYFVHTAVCWSNEISTKPTPPVVLLTLRNLHRHPYALLEDGEDEKVHGYPSTVTLEINLFSTGDQVNGGYSDNTMADLNEFLLYLNSPNMTDHLYTCDITIETNDVLPVSQLLGEAKYEFRAMTELQIDFTQHAAGGYGVRRPAEELEYRDHEWVPPKRPSKEEWTPTSSGGGLYEYGQDEEGYIETVETKEVTPNGKD